MIPGVRNQLKSVRYEIAGHTSVAASSVQMLPAVDPVTHTAQLRVALPAGIEGLVPGMFARVWVPGSSANAVAPNGTKDAAQVGRVFVPITAIVRRAEMTGVYVMDAQGKPRLRQVRLGRTTGQSVEVLSGVSAGEQVVSEPASLGKKL
jgi:hypothetical protein